MAVSASTKCLTGNLNNWLPSTVKKFVVPKLLVPQLMITFIANISYDERPEMTRETNNLAPIVPAEMSLFWVKSFSHFI